MLERKNVQKYDWPELRGLLPNNGSSPQPRMATLAPYAPKGSAVSQVALSTTGGLNPTATTTSIGPSGNIPRKPIHAWPRTSKVLPVLAVPSAALPVAQLNVATVVSTNTSPNVNAELTGEVPPLHKAMKPISLESAVPTLTGLPVKARTIQKHPSAMLRRLNDQPMGGAQQQQEMMSIHQRRDRGDGAVHDRGSEGKQWVFQLPAHAMAAQDQPVNDEESSPAKEKERSGNRTKQGGLLQTNNSVVVRSTLDTIPAVGGMKRNNANHHGPMVTKRPFQSLVLGGAAGVHRGGGVTWKRSTDDALQVEGNSALNGDLTSANNALAALEASVAKVRQAKEQLAAGQAQMLTAFRGVVKSFLAQADADPMTRRNGAAALSFAKSSVVVHTLTTTIQSYLRVKISTALVRRLEQQSNGLPNRLSEKMPPPLSLQDLAIRGDYTPTCAAEETPLSTSSRSSLHDLLDNATISRLKQLYFDYYDCETFVLRPSETSGEENDEVQVLPMEERDMRHAIEEYSVGDDVYHEVDGVCHSNGEMDGREDTEEHIPEEFAMVDSPRAAHYQRPSHCDASRGGSAASIILNASRAVRDIFGSPRSASDLYSPVSRTAVEDVEENCEIEDL